MKFEQKRSDLVKLDIECLNQFHIKIFKTLISIYIYMFKIKSLKTI